MIRRINYTGRQRIRRQDVKITLKKNDNTHFFEARINLANGYNLPQNAHVFIEAYRQTTWMRFPFGTVGNISPPADLRLKEFDSPEAILFRIKVTANAPPRRLLAEADGIPLCNENAKKQSLLPVKGQDLGDEVYRIDYSNGPLLLINSSMGDWRAIAVSKAFKSIAYPAILREIFVRILIEEEYDDYSDLTDWRSKWLKYACSFKGLGDIPPMEQKEELHCWIDNAVAEFARRMKLKESFKDFWERDNE